MSVSVDPDRLALFMPNARGGGAERMMVNLANGFAVQGLEVDLVLSAADGPYLAEVGPGVRVVDLGSASVLRSLPRLARYLKDHRPAVLLSTLRYANLVALWARRWAGGRTRVYLREASMLSVSQTNDPKSRAVSNLVRRFYRMADGVIAVSQGVADDVRAVTGVERVTTIYNPVVTPEFLRQCAEPLEHPWFADGLPVILGVGRLTPKKDFQTLLRAVALVRHSRPVRVVILGEGEERSRLESLVADLDLRGAVALPGFVDNPFNYMANASLFVLSSQLEGLPGALIQALACGCPVVSTDCPSGPAEVLEHGRFGPLVPVEDPRSLAQAILDVLETPPNREALMQRGRQFSLEASVQAYLGAMGLAHPSTVATA